MQGKIVNVHPCGPVFEVEMTDALYRIRPEQSVGVWVNAWVEIVDLGREVREVILTSVEVQSNKAKSAFVDCSVHSDVHTAHKAHVGVEQQSFLASIGIRCCARALNVGNADNPVKVPDR